MPSDPKTALPLPIELERLSSWELSPGAPLYSGHRTVTAVLAVERVGPSELYPGARQRRIEALEREAHAQHKTPQGASFAQVLENKQKPP